MLIHSHLQRVALAALLLAGLSGCGGDLKTYSVPGKLAYQDGTAVPGASIVLQTTVGDKVISARGMATPDGRFTLTTFKPGDGVVAGDHQVSISPLPAPDGAKPAQPPVPNQYWDFTTSGLTTTVTPQTSEIVLTINRSAKK